MTELWQITLGAAAVALGLAWIVAPIKMSNLQSRLLYLGRGEEIEETDKGKLYGRISGVLLAILGVVLALGIEL